MLPEALAEGLRHIEVTTQPDNVASRRVIEANGGMLIEEFVKPAGYGGGIELRYPHRPLILHTWWADL